MARKLRAALFVAVAVAMLLALNGCVFTQYLAHYVNGSGWTTLVKIQNPYATQVTVTITAFSDAGAQQAEKSVDIPASGFYKAYVSEIFGRVALPVTGSLKITCSEPGDTPRVNSIAVLDYPDGPSMGGLQSFSNPQKVVFFPTFENSATAKTGVAILNVNSYKIQVFLKATSDVGGVFYSQIVTLDPMQKLLGYPGDFFEGRLPTDCALTAYGSGPIAGFLMLHDPEVTRVEAVNGAPLVATSPHFGDSDSPVDLNLRPVQFLPSADGNLLYAFVENVGSGPGGVAVLDGFNPTSVLRTVCSSGQSGSMALGRGGRYLYVGNTTTDKVYRFDGLNPADTGTAMFDFKDPFYLDCSPDGHYIAVADTTSVSVLEMDSWVPWAGEGGLGHVTAVRFTPDSKYLLVLDQDGSKIRIFDMATGATTNIPLSTGGRDLVVDPFSSSAWVATGTSKVLNVSISSKSEQASGSLDVGAGQECLAISPDGRYLYVPTYSDGKLWVRDILYGNWRIAGTYALSGGPTAIAVSPDGARLYYAANKAPYALQVIK